MVFRLQFTAFHVLKGQVLQSHPSYDTMENHKENARLDDAAHFLLSFQVLQIAEL